jgi:hypothetical protein
VQSIAEPSIAKQSIAEPSIVVVAIAPAIAKPFIAIAVALPSTRRCRHDFLTRRFDVKSFIAESLTALPFFLPFLGFIAKSRIFFILKPFSLPNDFCVFSCIF